MSAAGGADCTHTGLDANHVSGLILFSFVWLALLIVTFQIQKYVSVNGKHVLICIKEAILYFRFLKLLLLCVYYSFEKNMFATLAIYLTFYFNYLLFLPVIFIYKFGQIIAKNVVKFQCQCCPDTPKSTGNRKIRAR